MKRRRNLQCKSSTRKDQIARPESCFRGQNLFITNWSTISFVCKSVLTLQVRVKSTLFLIFLFLEVTTSCQFRPAQQQSTIWTLVSEELRKLLLKFLGPELFHQIKSSLLKNKSDILLIKNKTKPNLIAFFQLNNLRFYKIFTFRQLSPDFHLAEWQRP